MLQVYFEGQKNSLSSSFQYRLLSEKVWTDFHIDTSTGSKLYLIAGWKMCAFWQCSTFQNLTETRIYDGFSEKIYHNMLLDGYK